MQKTQYNLEDNEALEAEVIFARERKIAAEERELVNERRMLSLRRNLLFKKLKDRLGVDVSDYLVDFDSKIVFAKPPNGEGNAGVTEAGSAPVRGDVSP